MGIRVSICNGSYLWHPKDILKDDGSYYKVFTAYKNKALTMPIRQTIEQPNNIITVRDENNKTVIEDLKLTSSHEWYDKVSNYWEYGEEAAKRSYLNFCQENWLDINCSVIIHQKSIHLFFLLIYILEKYLRIRYGMLFMLLLKTQLTRGGCRAFYKRVNMA